jgi:hypothetical protein
MNEYLLNLFIENDITQAESIYTNISRENQLEFNAFIESIRDNELLEIIKQILKLC